MDLLTFAVLGVLPFLARLADDCDRFTLKRAYHWSRSRRTRRLSRGRHDGNHGLYRSLCLSSGCIRDMQSFPTSLADERSFTVRKSKVDRLFQVTVAGRMPARPDIGSASLVGNRYVDHRCRLQGIALLGPPRPAVQNRYRRRTDESDSVARGSIVESALSHVSMHGHDILSNPPLLGPITLLCNSRRMDDQLAFSKGIPVGC